MVEQQNGSSYQQFVYSGGWPRLLISDGIGNTVGAPSFAFLAKGGNHERLGPGVHPDNHRNGVGGIAAHPCKERKDGAPSPWIVRTEIKENVGIDGAFPDLFSLG
jgi:hypothetical protein